MDPPLTIIAFDNEVGVLTCFEFPRGDPASMIVCLDGGHIRGHGLN